MITIDRLFGALIIIWVFLYTISYGRWTWKKKNKLGGAAVIFLAFAVVFLVAYQVFKKQ